MKTYIVPSFVEYGSLEQVVLNNINGTKSGDLAHPTWHSNNTTSQS
jgi:hypothetical protein